MKERRKQSLQSIMLFALLAFFSAGSFNGYSQEGSVASKFAPGFYFDKKGVKHEGYIKYLIVKSGEVEKIKAFKFKAEKTGEPTKYSPETADGFGIDGSERIYHTIYKNSKARGKNKGGRFARVYIGGQSVREKASIYYPIKSAPSYLTKDGQQFLSAFIVRSGDNTKLTTVSLVGSKHKKLFKKYFKSCEAFNKALASNKKFLSVTNLENVIDLINESCK